jgi:hypothetical protein
MCRWMAWHGQPVLLEELPVVATRLVPKLATSFEERGANTIIAPA